MDPIPILVGLIAGFLGSILGVGGGSIITPVLVALGYNIKTVIPASLLAIVGTSIGGLDVYDRHSLVNYKVGIRLESTAIIGSLIGVRIALYVNEVILKVFLAGVLVYIGLSTLRKVSRKAEEEKEYRYDPVREVLGVAAGTLKGLVSALAGVGGGIIGVPILHRLIGLQMKEAIATSKLLVGMTAAGGFIGYAIAGGIDPCLGLMLSLGTITGGIAGSHAGVRLTNRAAAIIFSLFMIAMSIILIMKVRSYLWSYLNSYLW